KKEKNNCLLIGNAGVGKSAVVEGLAIKIAKGDVPDALRDKIIFSLDLGGLVAGTKYRGEFESKFKNAIDYIKTKNNVVLFIDEIHNLIGAGSTSDSKMSASELLKPLLSRGEISVIGATTLDEYTKYIEKDQALERRFQPIRVKEPTKAQAIEILNGLKASYEAHHKVKISNEAIVSAVNLSDRYIRDRFLPDKAIDLIDEASSKKRVEVTTVPKTIIELEKKVQKYTAERDFAISKNNLDGAKHAESEREKAEELLKKEYKILNNKRSGLDVEVTEADIKNVVSSWTKIPVGDLTKTEIDKLTNLEGEISKRVIGQEDAIKSVVRAIKRSSAKIKDPNKPIGSFIFVGSTGVGKSELSKAIAECVFDDKDALIRFDMSEYSDKTSVNKLIGSAPGYVGYEEEGLLTEKIRKNPYSVVLFDEIEKADSEIFDLLLQVLDEGRLTDSKGRLVSFKDAVIVLTSNVGYDVYESKKSVGFGSTYEDVKDKIEKALKEKFRPEFINRLDEIVVFNRLTEDNCKKIASLIFKSLSERVFELGIELVIDESAIDFIVEKAFDVNYGARPIKRAISKYVEDVLSDAIIEKDIEDGDRVTVYVDDGKIEYFKD
ncbi:MAG: ATP-dependent Clp protease ATP-binding subunit, partial [Clostridia bacterium]|nr:ATP-dependent Clp protease ATP-binding subunit [Clostridia bacterium]